MCPWFATRFHEEEHEYIKKHNHFHCGYNEKHIIFILTCDKHPYVGARLSNMKAWS